MSVIVDRSQLSRDVVTVTTSAGAYTFTREEWVELGAQLFVLTAEETKRHLSPAEYALYLRLVHTVAARIKERGR